jgi:hypothetical protein
MFAGTRWGGACFVGHNIFVSGGGGAAGQDDDDDDFVTPLSMVARQVGEEGGWVGDVGVGDETIAAGDEVKKTLQSTTREKEGGGEVQRQQRR